MTEQPTRRLKQLHTEQHQDTMSFNLLYLIPIVVASVAVVALVGWLIRRRRRTNSDSNNSSSSNNNAMRSKNRGKRAESALMPIIDPAALLSPGSREYDRYGGMHANTGGSSEFESTPSTAATESSHGSSRWNRVDAHDSPLTAAQADHLYRMVQSDPNVSALRLAFDKIAFERKLSSRNGASLCEVWLCQYEGEEVAVKLLRSSRRSSSRKFDDLQLLVSEIQLSVSLEHPNIARFLGVAWNAITIESLCLISEYLSMGNLQDYLQKRSSEGSVWDPRKVQIAVGVARALWYLHSPTSGAPAQALHRALRAKNVGLSHTFKAKLVDFSLHQGYNPEQLAAGAGNAFWRAPEVLSGQACTPQSDIYTFGVLLAEMDTNGEPPYQDVLAAQQLKPFQILNLVAMGQIRPSLSPSCPTRIAEVAAQCLQSDPAQRITADALVHRLERYYESLL